MLLQEIEGMVSFYVEVKSDAADVRRALADRVLAVRGRHGRGGRLCEVGAVVGGHRAACQGNWE